MKLTSKLGKVIVTCSPFPTSSSPSQVVSIEAGLKSSMDNLKKERKVRPAVNTAPSVIYKLTGL